jgi:hypothetical protein
MWFLNQPALLGGDYKRKGGLMPCIVKEKNKKDFVSHHPIKSPYD